MTVNDALEIAIDLIREKVEIDRLAVRLADLKPAYADRHAIARFNRLNSAITTLQGLKRSESEAQNENI